MSGHAVNRTGHELGKKERRVRLAIAMFEQKS